VLHQPFRRHLVHRRVALEVIRQNHGGVVADASVARVACSDSDICWRCCWCCARSEKCDYRRKRHKPGTSNYCEPHECVCVAKSAPQRVATDTNVGFIFRPARGILDLLIIRPRQPSSTSGGTIRPLELMPAPTLPPAVTTSTSVPWVSPASLIRCGLAR